jgi:hypothetical protein
MTDWYAFQGYNNGKAIAASATDSAILESLGMHFYPTAAEAQAHPNSVNIFQKISVNAAIDDYNNARDISPTTANNPTSPTSTAKAAANSAGQAAGKLPIPGVGNIDDVISWLSQGSIWERGAEILGGFVLLYIGVKAMTGLDPVGAAKNTATKAGKAAIFR